LLEAKSDGRKSEGQQEDLLTAREQLERLNFDSRKISKIKKKSLLTKTTIEI